MLPSTTRTGESGPRRKVKRTRGWRKKLQVSRVNFKFFFDDFLGIQGFKSISGRTSDHHSHTSSTHEDIIELQDVRMSPIASLRSRNYSQNQPENLDLAKFPPSFRITRSYSTSVRSGLRHRAARNSHRPKMLHALKRGASVIRASIPKIKDVNIIDEYSRVIFPVAFLMFNVGYWVFYVIEWWVSFKRCRKFQIFNFQFSKNF